LTIWFRYHLIFFGVPFISFLLFIIFSQTDYIIIGIIIGTCGVIFTFIYLSIITCPICKTPISPSGIFWYRKHYTGSVFAPKNCPNCNYDLDNETDKTITNNDS